MLIYNIWSSNVDSCGRPFYFTHLLYFLNVVHTAEVKKGGSCLSVVPFSVNDGKQLIFGFGLGSFFKQQNSLYIP